MLTTQHDLILLAVATTLLLVFVANVSIVASIVKSGRSGSVPTIGVLIALFLFIVAVIW